MPSDPFLSAYLHGSDQGLSLANQIANEDLAREAEARRAEQFRAELAFREREALVDNQRGADYLGLQRRNTDLNEQRWQAVQQKQMQAQAEEQAARAFDAQQYRDLMGGGGGEMGPPEPGRYVKADPAEGFAAMPVRARQSVLGDMQAQRERTRAVADKQMRREMMQRELQGLAKTKAAMMKQIDDAGGIHMANDPLVKQLLEPLKDIMQREAAIQAATMHDEFGVPMDSAMSFQTAMVRKMGGGPGGGGGKNPMDATTIRARVAKLRAQNQMYQRALGSLDENGDVPIYDHRDGGFIAQPEEYVRGMIEDNNLEIQQLIGMDPAADGGEDESGKRMGGDTRTNEELQLDAIERRMGASR